jgi:hypothetical protein
MLISTGCAHTTSGTRHPSSLEQMNEIDSRFEKPWQGDIQKEHNTLQDLGKTIGGFVEKEAKQNQEWMNEYNKLKQTSPLNKKQRQRLMAFGTIFDDLPQKQGFATRDVHRRPSGCLNASLRFNTNLPADLQKGFFQPSARYDAVVRFSNGNPRNLPDYAPDARGMAVKLLPENILEKNLSAAELNREGLLDLLAINFPVFFVNDPKVYVGVNQAFLAVSDDPVAALDPKSLYFKFNEFLSVYAKGMTRHERKLALEVNGSIIANPLFEEYWSMMSYRLGAFEDESRTAIKFKWTPCALNLPQEGYPDWSANHDYAKPRVPGVQKDPYDLIPEDLQSKFSKNRYYLRSELYSSLPTTSEKLPNKCFYLEVQRYLDEKNTPVEDTTEIWVEDDYQRAKFGVKNRMVAKPITIAKLTIQPISEDEKKRILAGNTPNTDLCENLSFDPWNNVSSAHKPLGIVGRMRNPLILHQKLADME